MYKTITLRLDEATYEMFYAVARSDHRPLSNTIATAAKTHLKKCLYANGKEMASILANKPLLNKLKRGSLAAKRRAGRFVD